jgi:hypothetical protein
LEKERGDETEREKIKGKNLARAEKNETGKGRIGKGKRNC